MKRGPVRLGQDFVREFGNYPSGQQFLSELGWAFLFPFFDVVLAESAVIEEVLPKELVKDGIGR